MAEHLLDIYIEHGPPEILQSDQGPEFKGVVKTVCETLNVRIIKSSAIAVPRPKEKTSAHTERGRKK